MDVESHILNRLLFHGSRSFPAFGVWRLRVAGGVCFQYALGGRRHLARVFI